MDAPFDATSNPEQYHSDTLASVQGYVKIPRAAELPKVGNRHRSDDHERYSWSSLAGGAGERLYPLTRDRAKPAVTFGGIYRIIDITLSNCLNSDLRRVYILTQYKALSLNRHIREGWNIVGTRRWASSSKFCRQ